MDWLEFTASILSSTAWPISAVMIALVFKSPIARLLERVKTAKVFGAELGIGDELQAIRDRVELAPKAVPIEAAKLPAPAIDLGVEKLKDALSKESATGTIVAAWLDLEAGLKSISEVNGLNWSGQVLRSIRELQSSNLVPQETANAIFSLRDLRNKVVHSRDAIVTIEEAAAYRSTVQEVLSTIGLNASNEAWR